MSEVVGIKESLEVFDLLELIGVELAGALKDGFSGDDLPQVLIRVVMSEEFQAGVQGLKDIPAEVKDISAKEGVELGIRALKIVPAILAALEKEV